MQTSPPTKSPSSAQALLRIEAKLDRIERALGPLAHLAEAPAVLATAVEAIDDGARGQQPQLDARLRGVASLLERISRPQTLATLQAAVELAESLPAVVSTAADTLDERGADLFARVEAALPLLSRLTSPRTLVRVQQVLDHLQRASAQDHRLGPLGFLMALRRPRARRALGFAASVLEHLGQQLEPPRSPPKQLRA